MGTQNAKKCYHFENIHDEDCNEYIARSVARNNFNCKVHFQQNIYACYDPQTMKIVDTISFVYQPIIVTQVT